MFSPFSIAGGLVVNASEKFELIQRHLFSLNSQLVVQLPLRGALHTQNGRVELSASLTWDTQGVRAASVGPHVREGDLLGGALLEEQLVLVVEEEDGEGTVEETLVNVGHQMACSSNQGSQ